MKKRIKESSFVGVAACAVVVCAGGGVVAAGCGPIGDPEDIDPWADLPKASDFSCDDLDGTETACVDFNDGDKHGFQGEGGSWQVVDGQYVGLGPDAPTGDCTSSLITHAIWSEVQAQDLAVHVRMASVKRVDKVLVLRSQDAANRIQLNFRALSENGTLGDLMVQELRDCEFKFLTDEEEVPVRHQVGEWLDVDVDLIGQHLVVKVDGDTVFDRQVDVAVAAGRVGVGVIDHSESVFDDIVVRSHDDG